MSGFDPNDPPSAAELVEAVREFLEHEVMGATEGSVRFHTRVAANVLAMVERELRDGRRLETDHATRLASLGVASEADLAAAIRAGQLDDRLDVVRAVVQATVLDKVRVANPGYLDPDDADPTSAADGD